jgi:hypothetical protein
MTRATAWPDAFEGNYRPKQKPSVLYAKRIEQLAVGTVRPDQLAERLNR